jgi:hypothetical protein
MVWQVTLPSTPLTGPPSLGSKLVGFDSKGSGHWPCSIFCRLLSTKSVKLFNIEDPKQTRSSMAPRSVRFGVRSRRLNNVDQSWMSDQKFIISSFYVLWKVPAVFTVVSTHQPALGPRGRLWSRLLICIP